MTGKSRDSGPQGQLAIIVHLVFKFGFPLKDVQKVFVYIYDLRRTFRCDCRVWRGNETLLETEDVKGVNDLC